MAVKVCRSARQASTSLNKHLHATEVGYRLFRRGKANKKVAYCQRNVGGGTARETIYTLYPIVELHGAVRYPVLERPQ